MVRVGVGCPEYRESIERRSSTSRLRGAAARGEGRTGSRFFVQVRQSNRKVVHAGSPSCLSPSCSRPLPPSLFLCLCLPLVNRRRLCVHPSGDAAAAAGRWVCAACAWRRSLCTPVSRFLSEQFSYEQETLSSNERFRARWRYDWQRTQQNRRGSFMTTRARHPS